MNCLKSKRKKVQESVENVALNPCLGNKQAVDAKNKLDSNIIDSSPHYNERLITWLREVNRKSVPKLLYRASRDGWQTHSFHSLCDAYKHTLVVVKTNQGYIFGGYSNQSWKGFGFKKSDRSFLFTLKCYAGLRPHKMKVKAGMEKTAVYLHPTNGPCFGDGQDFWIVLQGRKKDRMKKGWAIANQNYEIPAGAAQNFLAGKSSNEYFHFEEIEVFKV